MRIVLEAQAAVTRLSAPHIARTGDVVREAPGGADGFAGPAAR
jgi:hypothetical protein